MNNQATILYEDIPVVDINTFATILVATCDELFLPMPSLSEQTEALALNIDSHATFVKAFVVDHPVVVKSYKAGMLKKLLEEVGLYLTIFQHLQRVGILTRVVINTNEVYEEKITYTYTMQNGEASTVEFGVVYHGLATWDVQLTILKYLLYSVLVELCNNSDTYSLLASRPLPQNDNGSDTNE